MSHSKNISKTFDVQMNVKVDIALAKTQHVV